jgi:hypothetical protein
VITWLQGCHLAANRIDNSTDFQPDNQRKYNMPFIGSVSLGHVAPTDAAGPNRYEDVAWTVSRNRDISELK